MTEDILKKGLQNAYGDSKQICKEISNLTGNFPFVWIVVQDKHDTCILGRLYVTHYKQVL